MAGQNHGESRLTNLSCIVVRMDTDEDEYGEGTNASEQLKSQAPKPKSRTFFASGVQNALLVWRQVSQITNFDAHID